MKKPSPAPKFRDHICATAYKAKRRTSPHAKELYADPSPPKLSRTISYIPGAVPPKAAKALPRLFIQGLIGGSVGLDLSELGIQLSEAAYGYWVADETLRLLDIHRGDIAFLDLTNSILRDGNLILVIVEGKEVFRLLKRRGQLWYLEQADGKEKEPVVLFDQPIYGIVVGTMRLFTKVKAVRYRRKSVATNTLVSKQSHDPRLASQAPVQRKDEVQWVVRHRSTAQRGDVALVAEHKDAYRLAGRVVVPSADTGKHLL